jgi:MFS family permease
MFRLNGLYKNYLFRKGLNKLIIVSFLISFSLAMFETIWAVYLRGFTNNLSLIGFLSSFFTIIAIFSYLFLVPFIEKYDKAKLYSLSLFFYAFCFFLFAINKNFYIFMVIGGIFFISRTLNCNSFGLIVKDFSKKNELSKNEGFIYTFLNIAWVLGPLLGGYLASRYSLNLIFVLSGILIFLGFFSFRMFRIKDVHIKKEIDRNFYRNIIDFFSDKNRALFYFLSGGVIIWWVFIYLFMPLYILENGLGKIWVGYFLFAVALPLVFFEYYFSTLCIKKGFKIFFKLGYFIIFIFALICYFIPNIYLILLLLVFASFGVAMLEPTVETYFFEILKKDQDLKYYSLYNTRRELNLLIAKIFAAFLLLFLPFIYLFLLFAGIMLIMFFLSFFIKDFFECKKGIK